MEVKFSIVTVNRNNAEGLEATIISVTRQKYPDFEFLVIDGCSSDRSLDVIENYKDSIHYFVSESDEGVYDAMNKGIKQAKGEYIIFMNSGDLFASDNVLENVARDAFDCDFIFGSTIYKKGCNRMIWDLPAKVSFLLFFSDGVCHQSSFIKRTLFDEIGYYDKTCRIVADWKFFILALAKYNKKVKVIKEPVSIYDMDGISSNISNREVIRLEREKVLKQEFQFFFADYAIYVKIRRYLLFDIKGRFKYKLFNLKNRFE